MVVDLEHLTNEIAQIREKGVVVTPKNLKLSKRATISMPWHKIQDELEETRLAKTGAAFGSTKRGIAYAYSHHFALHLVAIDLEMHFIVHALEYEEDERRDER